MLQKRKTKSTSFYVKNEDLLPEMIDFATKIFMKCPRCGFIKEIGQEDISTTCPECNGPIKKKKIASEKLSKMIYDIAYNLSSSSSFSGYTWREDMVQDAVLTFLIYGHKFDFLKTDKPFAYITTICINAFRKYLRKQKVYAGVKSVCYDNSTRLLNFDEIDSYADKAIDYTILKY